MSENEESVLFHGIDLSNEKEVNLFFKTCEFICRKSVEYGVWQKRSKMNAVNQNPDPDKNDSEYCPVCNESYEFVQPESHHHPITLFNLIVKQFQDWMDKDILDEKYPLDLVQEVMFSHMINNVQNIVLCKHCHEKYHNGDPTVSDALKPITEHLFELKEAHLPDSIKSVKETARNNYNQTQQFNQSVREDLFINDLDINENAGVSIEQQIDWEKQKLISDISESFK